MILLQYVLKGDQVTLKTNQVYVLSLQYTSLAPDSIYLVLQINVIFLSHFVWDLLPDRKRIRPLYDCTSCILIKNGKWISFMSSKYARNSFSLLLDL